jgi:hypothetical protein
MYWPASSYSGSGSLRLRHSGSGVSIRTPSARATGSWLHSTVIRGASGRGLTSSPASWMAVSKAASLTAPVRLVSTAGTGTVRGTGSATRTAAAISSRLR